MAKAINDRYLKKWRYEKAVRLSEIKKIELYLEENFSHKEILNQLANHIYATEHQSEKGYRSESWGERYEIESEMIRLAVGGPDLAGDIDPGSDSLISLLHHLAAVSADKGRIIGATLKAQKGAAEKLANDPKQHAKERVYEAWIEWTEGRAQHGKQNKQADFARAMLKEWEGVLVSQPTIEAWCRQWKRGQNIPLTEPAQ